MALFPQLREILSPEYECVLYIAAQQTMYEKISLKMEIWQHWFELGLIHYLETYRNLEYTSFFLFFLP